MKSAFVAGDFLDASGEPLQSVDPSRDGAVVAQTRADPGHITIACAVAHDASAAWSGLGIDDRWDALTRFRDALVARKADIAEALVRETGKLRSEAVGEAGALISRFDLVRKQVRAMGAEAAAVSKPGAALTWRPHGVVGVIGPFNYPLHLCHAHVVPALLLGNTVVVKPAETTLLCGRLYAEAAAEAGLPPGVLNVVAGSGAAGAALVADENVRGLCFTGSWATGRRILQAALDRPELLCALEMGGKNAAVVLDDADIRQAAHEVAVGGYLTAGQRCTCTESVLVDAKVADALRGALVPIVKGIRYGDPDEDGVFAGPMATRAGRDRFVAAIKHAEDRGATRLAAGAAADGPFFARPTLHEVAADIRGYTDDELFGPDIALRVVDGPDEAVALLSANPFGLVTSVFTADSERYRSVAARVHAGLVHHNRTTNQASGALPFGGVGRSGNFRPAGSFAPRNVAYPVAAMANPTGAFTADSRLLPLLPQPDLAALAARHEAEDRADASRDDRLENPRPMRVLRPAGGKLPISTHWLERFYGGGRFAREKKPGVVDHGRSHGPWMCSVDEQPLCVLDGMSQTATQADGFAPDEVVAALLRGEFDGTIDDAPDTADGHVTADAYAATLRAIVPGLDHVAFANSGAEANEKAIALAALHGRTDARRVLAFEGSFHGRTLLALHATWNPKKREPFAIAGFDATFAPFPVRAADADDVLDAPNLYWKALGARDLAAVRSRFAGRDRQWDAEIAVLEAVHIALAGQPHTAVLVEPMQSEGGDRYTTARFHRGLRLLTRAHGVPLIVDEVQCGFGLSGPFAWHSRFAYIDAAGNPDVPDAVTFAKRAQVGVVMSNWPDPEPTSSHAASLVRGRIHAVLCADPEPADRVHARVARHLAVLAAQFPDLVANPRVDGFAFAFDLPASAYLPRWIGQRFWRGAVVFAAGSKTVRYRLSRAFSDDAIDRLFVAIRQTAAWLIANPGKTPPSWDDPAPSPAPVDSSAIRVREVDPAEIAAVITAIVRLEAEVYEEARRDDPEHLATAFLEGGIAIIAEDEQGYIVGSCLGAPLERFGHVAGCAQDPRIGDGTTLYSTATTVHPDFRGLGVGRRMKTAQLAAARGRYKFVTGRNRVGAADTMTRLVRSLGGVVTQRLRGQYEGDGDAVYYTVPLTARSAMEHAAVTKLTLCNYLTPATVRAVEMCCAHVPELPHLYLTSSRDELVDKALRVFRWQRKEASVALTFDGSYFGHTTAAARSLSDPAVHQMGPAWRDWPRLPHPADVGSEVAAEILRDVLEGVGAQAVLCIAVDPRGERSGKPIPADFWPLLAEIRTDFDVPLLALDGTWNRDHAHGGPFARPRSITPDIFGWWTGGQAGLLHVSARFFEGKPLTFVSTWDGDELSLLRVAAELDGRRRCHAAATARDTSDESATTAGLHRRHHQDSTGDSNGQRQADSRNAAGVYRRLEER